MLVRSPLSDQTKISNVSERASESAKIRGKAINLTSLRTKLTSQAGPFLGRSLEAGTCDTVQDSRIRRLRGTGALHEESRDKRHH